MLYIGIDLGTSAVKLLLMDGTGAIRKIVSREYPLYFPHPAWSEQDPEDWFKASMEGIKELTADCGAHHQVSWDRFGGRMHGLVTLDEADQVIRPAILWNDGRSEKETDYLNTVVGMDKLSPALRILLLLALQLQRSCGCGKMSRRILNGSGRLCCQKTIWHTVCQAAFCTDYSDAFGMLLLDVKNKCWSRK